MRVLLTHRPGGAYGYISESWMNALNDTGHQAVRWDGSLSMWENFKPDLYLGCSGHRQPIPAKRGSTIIAIHANPRGSADTGLNESPSSIAWVEDQKPHAVFGYGFSHDSFYWAGWEKAGIPWIPLPNAADTTIYKHTNTGKRSRNISYVGGYWPYKGQDISRWLMPLFSIPNVAINGWGNWPAQFGKVEGIDDADMAALLNDTLIAPCISEPHTKSYGFDLPERVFKVIAMGALAIHDWIKRPPGMKSLIIAETPADLLRECESWLAKKPAEIEKRASKQRAEVLAGHTYHHRMAFLLHKLGLDLGGLKEFLEQAKIST